MSLYGDQIKKIISPNEEIASKKSNPYINSQVYKAMQDNFRSLVEEAFSKLDNYTRLNNYKGWDLFDGLNSEVLQKSSIYKYPPVRLAWIQAFKRSPINFRAITRVPKSNNSKGFSLFLSGLVYSGRLSEAKELYSILINQAIKRKAGYAWGYNFPWESRAFYVPEGTPNVVSTVFVANALLDYFDATGNEEAFIKAASAADFILDELLLYEDEESVCFGYIPGEDARVHNASMMAAALLGRVFSLSGSAIYLEKSRKAMSYAINALKPDYSWPYGERSHHQFVDSFHTGFNLVALHDWMKSTRQSNWNEQLRKAYSYYIDNFWLSDGCPKYYNTSLYPIDIHASAQGIVTCTKLADIDERSHNLAQNIATWTIENMQSDSGYFYFQKKRFWKNKIPYIRWSQAWMFYALSILISSMNATHKEPGTQADTHENMV